MLNQGPSPYLIYSVLGALTFQLIARLFLFDFFDYTHYHGPVLTAYG